MFIGALSRYFNSQSFKSLRASPLAAAPDRTPVVHWTGAWLLACVLRPHRMKRAPRQLLPASCRFPMQSASRKHLVRPCFPVRGHASCNCSDAGHRTGVPHLLRQGPVWACVRALRRHSVGALHSPLRVLTGISPLIQVRSSQSVDGFDLGVSRTAFVTSVS